MLIRSGGGYKQSKAQEKPYIVARDLAYANNKVCSDAINREVQERKCHDVWKNTLLGLSKIQPKIPEYQFINREKDCGKRKQALLHLLGDWEFCQLV